MSRDTAKCAYCGTELVVARLPWRLRDGKRVFCNLVHKNAANEALLNEGFGWGDLEVPHGDSG